MAQLLAPNHRLVHEHVQPLAQRAAHYLDFVIASEGHLWLASLLNQFGNEGYAAGS
ncbi:hypothetical protein ACF08M_15565 [Streptomyces sp. NPDC015032]|uniref:hypothetical protein n=1 Tax=Streptomyces sp. NPDC015032 TaxID=3364937 RepID=UPI0036FEBF59